MLEERAKARAAADLEHALSCFKVDRRGAMKKIQDVNFKPLPATSKSEVKTDQPPYRPVITHDEWTAMVADQVRLFEIHMHENLSQFMDGHDQREEKKYETLVLPQHVSISGSALVALANHNMG